MLVSGTAGAQLLMVLAAPLLTRLYTPADFGLLAVYVGLLSLFAVIASLRYELAIPLPESDQEAANVTLLSLACVAGMTVISAILVLTAGDQIAVALDSPRLGKYLWILPIGVMLQGAYQVFSYWSIRTKQFTTIARTKINQSMVTVVIQLLAHKAGGVSLLIGQTLGQGIGSVSLARSALKNREFRHCSWRGMVSVARRYRQLPLYSSWAGLFNTAGQQLPPLMFAALFGISAAGLYALAHRMLMMPMSLIGNAIANVFFSDAAEAHRAGKLGPLVTRVHKQLAQVAMPPTVILMVVGPDLFNFAFGEEWRQAGEFARWMAPWLYMVFVTSPLSTLLSVLERERLGMVLQIVLLIGRVVALIIGAWHGDLIVAVVLFSAVSTIYWAGFLMWVALTTGNNLPAVLSPTLKSLFISLACASPLILGTGTYAVVQSAWLAILSTTVLFAIYYLNLFRKAYRS